MFSEKVLSPQQCSPCAFSSILIRSFSFKSRGYSSSRSNHWQIFLKIGVLKNFAIFTWKHLCWSLYLITLEAWWPATLLKKRLQHRCFLVNTAKFLRAAFLQNTSGGCFCSKLDLNKMHQYSLQNHHVYSTSKRNETAFPRCFNVEYRWCVCKVVCVIRLISNLFNRYDWLGVRNNTIYGILETEFTKYFRILFLQKKNQAVAFVKSPGVFCKKRGS